MPLEFGGELGGRIDPEARARLEAAYELARKAGDGLVTRLRRADAGLAFKGRRELVTAADLAAEREIVGGIRARFPDDAVLAEEGVLGPRGRPDRDARVVWVVDPLDGTTNYVQRHPSFSVSIGVLRAGRPWLGVVHAPLLGGREGGTTYWGIAGTGAWSNDGPLRVSTTERLRDAVVATGFSYNRNEPGVNTNLENFGRVLMEVRGIRRCGSAALDLAHVAAGIYDAFWELYLAPYDVAAGIALVLGAGGTVRDLGSGCDPLSGLEVLATNAVVTEELAGLLDGVPGQCSS